MRGGAQRASETSSGGLFGGSRLSQALGRCAAAGVRHGAGGEHPARDLLRPPPGGTLCGSVPGFVGVDDGSGLGGGGYGVEHGAERTGQRRLVARLRIATRCVLLGIEAQHLAPAPAQLQHAGAVVVGCGVRRAPDVAQLAEPVAEDLLHHGGNRAGLAVIEDVSVHPRQHQSRHVRGVPGGHARVGGVGQDERPRGRSQPVPVPRPTREMCGLDPRLLQDQCGRDLRASGRHLPPGVIGVGGLVHQHAPQRRVPLSV